MFVWGLCSRVCVGASRVVLVGVVCGCRVVRAGWPGRVVLGFWLF